MTQGTQGLLGKRSEQLGSSDRGVIKFRKIVLDAINRALDGGPSQGRTRGQGSRRGISFGHSSRG
jgi:hypothetical protein